MSIPLFRDGETDLDAEHLNPLVTAANLATNANRGVANVLDYNGVVGNGIHDDSAGIQAAINDGYDLDFPDLNYALDGVPLDIDRQLSASGRSQFHTRIIQKANDVPIFRWTGDLSAELHGVTIERLRLEYQTQSDEADTAACAFEFRPDDDDLDTLSVGGFYHSILRDIHVFGAHTILGISTADGGTMPVWGNHFENIQGYNIAGQAVSLEQDGNAGQPANLFTNWSIMNNGIGPPVSGLPCFAIKAGVGTVLTNINVEDWAGEVLNSYGGSGLVVNGLRLERHRISGTNPRVVLIADSPAVLNGLDFLDCYLGTVTGFGTLVYASGSIVTVNGFIANRSTTGSTSTPSVTMLFADPDTGAEIVATGVVDEPGQGIYKHLPTAWGDFMYGIVSLNGKPPSWDTLPTAAAYYRGRFARTEGGAGVADVTYVCRKNSSDVYEWGVM